MKFEEIKDIWNAETERKAEKESPSFPEKNYSSPIKKIQTMLRFEFFFTWGFILLFGIAIFNLHMDGAQLALFFYTIAIITTIYYHSIFYRLYRKSVISNVDAYQNLIEFIIEYRYGIHLYRSYNYVLALILSPLFIIIYSHYKPISFSTIWDRPMMYWAISTFLGYIIVFVEIWIHIYYKKHLKNLQAIVQQLKNSDEEIPQSS